MNLLSITTPSGLSPEYPPPPRVHWATLLVVWVALLFTGPLLVPVPFLNLYNSVVSNAWAVYFCIWLRRLNPEATSFFWCDVYVVVELSTAFLTGRPHRGDLLDGLAAILTFASFLLGLTTIFIIRRELLDHYNHREPIGLDLSGAMTFFFSFLYFQARLYPIAKRKEHLGKETLLPPYNG